MIDAVKIISFLKEEAKNKERLPETKKFKTWKYLAIIFGVGLNITIGLLWFKLGAMVPGFAFLVVWNIMTCASLIMAKFLRYLTRWYRYVYLIIALWPLLSLASYIGFWLMIIKCMNIKV